MPIERLPKWLLCIPLVLQWLWLSLKYRSLTLPSAANPQIDNGGLVGESKFSYLRQIGPDFKSAIAPTYMIASGENPETRRLAANMVFPLIVKPDIGWCGYGVRRVDTTAQLRQYAQDLPQGTDFLIQQFLPDPCEAGLFYVRQPDEAVGRLTSVTIRHNPAVTGDGVAAIAQLLHKDKSLPTYLINLLDTQLMAQVPAKGETVRLTTVASLRFGGRYEDAGRLITPALTQAVDRLCRSLGAFHWGRLDVKAVSETALAQGRFTVFEINGAGSEAIHLWDPSISMRDAFKGVFDKQRQLFMLADRMARRGHRPVGIVALAKAYRRQQNLIAQYPPSN